MIKAVVLLVSLILITPFSYADSNEMRRIDSLSQLLEKQSGSQKIRTLQLLVEQYRSLSPAKSIEKGEAALKDEQLARQPDAQATMLRTMASSAQYAGDLDLAEQFLRRAIMLCRTTGNKLLLGHMLTELGNQYQRQGRIAEARNVLNEALEHAKKLDNDTIALKAHIELGNTAYDAGYIHQAMVHYRQSLVLATKLKDVLNKARTMLNMGMANWQFDNNELAISMLKEAASILDSINEIQTLGIVYNNLGLIYFTERKDYDSAAIYYNASYRIREQLGSPIPLAHVLVNQANLLTATNKINDAIELYERALELFSRAGIRSQVVRVHYHLGEAMQMMGNRKASRVMFEKTLELARQDGLDTYERLARQKLLDLYAEAGDWKVFMEQFAHFRKQHNELLDEYNLVSVREIQLQDTLVAMRTEANTLASTNAKLQQRVKLLESILISLATVVGAIMLIIITRRMILKLIPGH